jgi:hypothetical protein
MTRTRHPAAVTATLAGPADLLIPPAPCFRWIPASSALPWWRDAMRWALIGLTTSFAAGEITLWLTLG